MKKVLFGISACVFSLAFGAADTASAIDEVLDQSFVLTRFLSWSSLSGSNNKNLAQVVHVGTSGQLSRIDFWTHRTGNSVADLSLDIRPVEANLHPVENDLRRLGRIIIPLQNIAVLAGTSDISPYLYSADLTSLNLHFNAGDYFAFNFSSATTGSTSAVIMGDIAPDPGFYSQGDAFQRITDTTFFQWNNGEGDSVDLGFRTFVLVPEPSSILLCLAGIFATLMRRQRTRSSTS